jgi:hypothetical protein
LTQNEHKGKLLKHVFLDYQNGSLWKKEHFYLEEHEN